MKPFEADGERMKLAGFASLPDVTTGNRSHQYFFVNRRYIKDRLLYHAVTQAYESLVSRGRFPHIVLFLNVPPEEVDINVHPTKAEIRFKNERAIHRLVRSTVRNAVQGEGLSFHEKVESVYHSIFPDRPPRGRAVHEPTLGLDEGDGTIGAGQQGLRESPVSLFDEEGETPVISSGNLYWQLHQSFIMIQIRGGMVIVDQHAAHERILYNEAKRNLLQQKPVVQSLLFPATIELTPEEFEAFEELAAVLPKLGFEVEPFGMRSVIVHGIPAGARNWEEGRLFQEILGETGSEGGGVDALLKSFACRAAVKAGAKLSAQEMESLSDQLFDTEFPFTCPHGRPTMLRVEIADLERRFKRTVTT
jgi:DNA mismatch repair protein MutL